MARRLEQTASPARNFTLTTEERVRAIVTGVPAWARRRKRIEELSAQIPELHRAGEGSTVKKRLAELVKLVDAHNAYYPIEANLPLDPETSRLMELGEPWRPLPWPTLESLLEADARSAQAPASLAWSEAADALSVAFDATDDDDGDEHFIVRLDEEGLSCATSEGEIVRVAIADIEEISGGPFFEVVTRASTTVRFPFRLEESLLPTLVRELGARLRAMRSAAAGYRGDD